FFAGELAGATNGFRLLSDPLLRRFLVMLAEPHLAEDAFALHLLLQRPEGLVNVVVTDKNLHAVFLFNPTVDDRPTTKAPRPLRTDMRKRCRYPITTLSILSLYSMRTSAGINGMSAYDPKRT